MEERKDEKFVCLSHLQFVSNSMLANPHQSPLCEIELFASINLKELDPDLSTEVTPTESLKTLRLKRTAESGLICAQCESKPANLLHFDTFSVYCGEPCFPEQRDSGILLEGLSASKAKIHIIHWFYILLTDEHWELTPEQKSAYEFSSANDSLSSFLSTIQTLITECRRDFPEGEFYCSKCHCIQRRQMFSVVARGPTAVSYYCHGCAMMTSLKHVFPTAMYCKVQGGMCGSVRNPSAVFTHKMTVTFNQSPKVVESLLAATTSIRFFGRFTCSHSIRLDSILIGSISARHVMKGLENIAVNGKTVGYSFGPEPPSAVRVSIHRGLCVSKETTISIEADATVQGDDDGLADVPMNYVPEVEANRFNIGDDGSIWERNTTLHPAIGVLEIDYFCDAERD